MTRTSVPTCGGGLIKTSPPLTCPKVTIKQKMRRSYDILLEYSKKDGGKAMIMLIITAAIPLAITIFFLLSLSFLGIVGLLITEGIIVTITLLGLGSAVGIALGIYLLFYICRIILIDGMGGEKNIVRKFEQIKTLFGPPYAK